MSETELHTSNVFNPGEPAVKRKRSEEMEESVEVRFVVDIESLHPGF